MNAPSLRLVGPSTGRSAPVFHGWVRTVYRAKAWYYRRKYPRLQLGRDVQIRGRLRLRLGVCVVIGDRCRVNRSVRFTGTGMVVIGHDSLLNGCWIGSWDLVEVGPRCLLANCEISDADFHNVAPERRHDPAGPDTHRPVHVGENVWIGSRALVLKGARIGDDSVVGAGSVVRGTIPARVVAVGNPVTIARQL